MCSLWVDGDFLGFVVLHVLNNEILVALWVWLAMCVVANVSWIISFSVGRDYCECELCNCWSSCDFVLLLAVYMVQLRNNVGQSFGRNPSVSFACDQVNSSVCCNLCFYSLFLVVPN